MMQTKVIIYLKDQSNNIQGPFTPQMAYQIFQNANTFTEWIWYESKLSWTPINQHNLASFLNIVEEDSSKPLLEKTKTIFLKQSLHFHDIQHLKAIIRKKNDIIEVQLDHMQENGCLMLCAKDNLQNPLFQAQAQILINIVDIQQNISENIYATIQGLEVLTQGEKKVQYKISWQKPPNFFKTMLAKKKSHENQTPR